ncbi:type I CRISPR-associated protein Cas7, partial [Thiolapillus sp.]
MATRGLYIFRHDSKLGNAHAHDLFERIALARKPDVTVPRAFTDYDVNVNADDLPQGVGLIRRVG